MTTAAVDSGSRASMQSVNALVIALVVLPWVVGLLAIAKRAGRGIFASDDIRSQADRIRAFGAS